MEKKQLLAFAAAATALVIAAAAYFLMKRPEAPAANTADTADTAASPAYGTDSPLDKKPELNPVEKTNPFSDIKTNPFE